MRLASITPTTLVPCPPLHQHPTSITSHPQLTFFELLARSRNCHASNAPLPAITTAPKDDVELTAENPDLPSTPAHAPPTSSKLRAVQTVLTVTEKAEIIIWAMTDVDHIAEVHISSRIVPHFPNYFRASVKANIVRAIRFWCARTELLDLA